MFCFVNSLYGFCHQDHSRASEFIEFLCGIRVLLISSVFCTSVFCGYIFFHSVCSYWTRNCLLSLTYVFIAPSEPFEFICDHLYFFFFFCVRYIFQHFFSNLPIIFQFQCAIAICTYFYFDDKLPFFYPATVKFDRDERRIIAEIARQKDLESKGIVFVMIIATNKHFNVAIKQRSSFIDKTNK